MSTTETARTVCTYCGVGCGVQLTIAVGGDGARRVVKAAGDKAHPTNFGRLCTKGATSAELFTAKGRLDSALVRPERGVEPVPRALDETITTTARRLRAIVDQHGPDAVSLYVSGQMTLEAQYLANKLAKGFIGTNQIESNSRLCMASAGTGYKLSLGADGPPGSYQDFDHADVFFVIGSNMADCHPILFLRMMDRVKAGAKLIVVDPRRTTTADKADLYLPIKPGTDLALLNGLLHLLVAQGDIDTDFIAEFTQGWEEMPAFLADYPPAVVAELTGLPEADIRQAAAWIGGAGNWMSCWTMGLNQSTHGTWNTNALVNLHLATGAICRPGSGPFSLTGQPNAMGGREMGYMGPGLPGQRSVLAEPDRAFIEDLWGIPAGSLRTDVGRGTVEMFSRMAEGAIKACWIICTNPIATVPNRRTVIAGLEAAELVITQDVFAETETNAYADVILPAAMWVESDGILINSERNLTLVPGVVPPPGDALPDWQLIARIACEMGYADAFTYGSAEEVFAEIQRCWNPATGYDLRGVSYQRLRETPVQWPAAPDGPDRNPIRYRNDGISQRERQRPDGSTPRLWFPTASGRAVFFPRPHGSAAELPDDEYPFVLNTGRVQHQWHTLTKTGTVAKLNKLNPGPFVEIHPTDAARLDVADGDHLELASRRGRAVVPAVVTDRVQEGCLFAPFHWNDLYGEYLAVNAGHQRRRRPAVLPARVQGMRRVPDQGRVPGHSGTRAGRGRRARAGRRGEHLGAGTRHRLRVAGRGARSGSRRRRETLPRRLSAWPGGGAAGRRGPHAATGRTVRARPRGMGQRRIGRDVLPVARPAERGGPRRHVGPADDHLAGGSAVGGAVGVADRQRRGLRHVGHRRTTRAGRPDADGALHGRRHRGQHSRRRRSAGDHQHVRGRREPGQRRHLLGVAGGRVAGPADLHPVRGAGVRRLQLRQLLRARAASGRETRRTRCTAADPADRLRTGLRRTGRPVARQSADRARDRFDRNDSGRCHGDRTGSGATVPPAGAPTGTPCRQPVVEPARRRQGGPPVHLRPVRDRAGVPGRRRADRPTQQLPRPGRRVARLDRPGGRCRGRDRRRRRPPRRGSGQPAGHQPRHTRPGPFPGRPHRQPGTAHPAASGNKEELAKWSWGRQAADLLAEYPVSAAAQDWVDVLKKLAPRQYSISSSPLDDPARVSLTVSVIRYDSPSGRRRKGVCSAFLADAPGDHQVPVLVQTAPHFRPPADPNTPMIMVGPGTGVAPFIGFLAERRARGHRARNWLFFGEQHEATDFYYRDELTGLRRDGVLTDLDLAFSRDQRTKVYVQDRMVEHGAKLWSWLQDGAHLYVCGDANRMAKDVDRVLREIVAQHGHLDSAKADTYVRGLAADKRYVRDVY